MNLLWQSITEVYPPSPTFTEENLPDLDGKIYLVTGGSYGVGRELAKRLYWKNAVVYVGTRSENRFNAAAQYIKGDSASTGELRLLKMDLMDLPTVVAAATKLKAEISRLDSVWYNAGIMGHPSLSTTVQGFEVHWGTNVVGHFLLNKLLTTLLLTSAEGVPWGTVRAIWLSSDANMFSPGPDGINWEDVGFQDGNAANQMTKYGQSKAAAILLAHEFASRVGDQGIASLALNPGHLITGMQENRPKWLQRAGELFSFDAKYGSYTELFAAFTPLEKNQNGAYIVPWGRFGIPRPSITEGLEQRGSGARLWDLLEESVKLYV
ncbi:uncharacterized protein V1516DRAFT_680210 [Lipomyces oligophaga]|uniref:uncharacterized protein n=1 Tax=Lipomyces oligophaga TaxID=45792 RepID=UPI0034CD694F